MRMIISSLQKRQSRGKLYFLPVRKHVEFVIYYWESPFTPKLFCTKETDNKLNVSNFFKAQGEHEGVISSCSVDSGAACLTHTDTHTHRHTLCPASVFQHKAEQHTFPVATQLYRYHFLISCQITPKFFNLSVLGRYQLHSPHTHTLFMLWRRDQSAGGQVAQLGLSGGGGLEGVTPAALSLPHWLILGADLKSNCFSHQLLRVLTAVLWPR